jgi:hypothetical protein
MAVSSAKLIDLMLQGQAGWDGEGGVGVGGAAILYVAD